MLARNGNVQHHEVGPVILENCASVPPVDPGFCASAEIRILQLISILDCGVICCRKVLPMGRRCTKVRCGLSSMFSMARVQ